MIGKSVAAMSAVVCCLVAVACSSSNGTNGAPGPQGQSVVGPSGPSGEAGSPGTPGSPGSPGAPGDAGKNGSDGPSGCGTVEIPEGVYGSACGVCITGSVACEVGPNGSLVEACVDPAGQYSGIFVSSSASATFPANPVSDPVGANITLVRAALTFVSPVQNNEADSGNATVFLAGLCANATTHCEVDVDYQMSVSNNQVNLCGPDGSGLWTDLGYPETTGVAADLVGVQITDFYPGFTDFDYRGAPESCVESEAGVVCTSLLSSREQLLGLECTDSGGTVRLWSCSVNAAGQAVVGCTGQAL